MSVFNTFENQTFLVTSLELPPFQIKSINNTTGDVVYSGLCFDLLDVLADTLNFRYRVVEPPDGLWGTRSGESGKWNGMIGMLTRKEVDFGVGFFTETLERSKVVDFMTPYMEEQLTYGYRLPIAKPYLKCFQPLSREVWLTAVAAVLVASLVIMFLQFHTLGSRHAMEPGSRHAMAPGSRHAMESESRHAIETGSRHTIKQGSSHVMDTGSKLTMEPGSRHNNLTLALAEFPHYLLQTYKSILLQSVEISLSTVSSRSFWAMWSFVCIILSSVYSANLVAFLSVTKANVPMDTLDDLAKQSRYHIGTWGSTALEELFKTSPTPIYSNIWQKMLRDESNIQPEIQTLIDKIATENFAAVLEVLVLQNYSQTNCDLYMAKTRFFPEMIAFPAYKGFPYLNIFNERILQIIEAGLVERWKEVYFKFNSGKCSHDAISTTARPATLWDNSGAILFLFSGLTLATFSLLVEILVNSYWTKSSATAKNKPNT